MPPLIDQYGKPLALPEAKAVPPMTWAPGMTGGGWFPIIREPFAGAWQQNVEIRVDTVLSNVTVFRCQSLISGDVAKLRIRIIRETTPGVWEETNNPAFSPVIRKPNHYQTRIQFFENWINSKLANGNTYVLKGRDGRGVVDALYVLDPRRVHPLVSDAGDVFYQLSSDNLAGLGDQTILPASEIIHDRWNCFFHPLVGMSPIYAAGLAAMQGIRIQEHSELFFRNGANPGGVLTAPGRINDETAARLRDSWAEKFTGQNVGKIAVLGDGLKYERMSVTAVDAQLIDQLRWTAEMVAAAYGVPAYKVGIGPMPSYNNIEALAQQYYSDCLQVHLEAVELCLDEGLALPSWLGVEFDLDGLLRMDTATHVKTLAEGVIGGLLKPDEARKKLNYGPVEGGDTPYLQQQNYSLAALAKRDASDDPFASGGGSERQAAPAPETAEAADAGEQSRAAMASLILRRSRIARLAA
jgi:HK97 family phage portal protein